MASPQLQLHGHAALMIRINGFSAVDLVAVIVSTHGLQVFFYRSVRLTKRGIAA